MGNKILYLLILAFTVVYVQAQDTSSSVPESTESTTEIQGGSTEASTEIGGGGSTENSTECVINELLEKKCQIILSLLRIMSPIIELFICPSKIKTLIDYASDIIQTLMEYKNWTQTNICELITCISKFICLFIEIFIEIICKGFTILEKIKKIKITILYAIIEKLLKLQKVCLETGCDELHKLMCSVIDLMKSLAKMKSMGFMGGSGGGGIGGALGENGGEIGGGLGGGIGSIGIST